VSLGAEGWSSFSALLTKRTRNQSSEERTHGSYLRDESLAVRATDTTEVLEGVITVAGSLQGGFGSYFRTS
jgi:hypothetical protein